MSKTAAHAEIDWSGAEVHDGELTVPLAGEPSKEWAARLGAVIERLEQEGRDWGAVKASAKKLVVAAVQPGSEADVRFFLEGAVQQANADFAPDEDESGTEDSGPDAEMTAAFRAFGEPPAGD